MAYHGDDNARKQSISADIHRMSFSREGSRKSTKSTCNCEASTALRNRTKTHQYLKVNSLRRFFSTVPEARNKYPPVTKTRQRRAQWRENLCSKVLAAARSRIPMIDFLKSYNVKQFLVPDLVAGLAVTGLHFPQGLAYGLLASLTPAIGMISTLFPVLIYMVFGSSAHTSIGTNAIVSIMIGDMLLEPSIKSHIQSVRNIHALALNVSNESASDALVSTSADSVIMDYKIAVVAGVTFYTGIIFCLMAIFKMGFLVTYLSQSFMSGFTTGVAVHIFSSQIKTALGVSIPASEGFGKLVKLYYNVFSNITTANLADVVVSLVCVVILLGVKILINERMELKIPVPIDFILLVVATIISHFAGLPEKFSVKSLGKVELGIPAPQIPILEPVNTLLFRAVEISLVTFFLNISVIKIIARRNGYEIDNDIETNAYGIVNIISAFFSNIPASIAPPRSTLLSSMGSKTTLNAASTTAIMLILIFYCGKLFESCPQAVLASMIMVAMKDLLKQVNVLPKLWKVNKNDFTTWLIAALTCVFTDIKYGLVFGVLVSLLSVINQSQRGRISVLGKSDIEDLFLDKDDYLGLNELPGMKIMRMESSLYFVTAEKFRKKIQKEVQKKSDETADGQHETSMGDDAKMTNDSGKDFETDAENMLPATIKKKIPIRQDTIPEESDDEEKHTNVKTQILIIDCLPINFIDGTGLDMLKLIIFELGCLDISVYLARCSRYMLHLLERSDIYDFFPRNNVFIGLPDAVHAAETTIRAASAELSADEDESMKAASRDLRGMSLTSGETIFENAYDHFLNRHGSIYQL